MERSSSTAWLASVAAASITSTAAANVAGLAGSHSFKPFANRKPTRAAPPTLACVSDVDAGQRKNIKFRPGGRAAALCICDATQLLLSAILSGFCHRSVATSEKRRKTAKAGIQDTAPRDMLRNVNLALSEASVGRGTRSV